MIAIHTGVHTYLDHIGVLSILLDIPLIVTDPETFHIAQIFYPELNCILKDPLELSLHFLASHYDVIVTSGHFWAAEMIPLFDLFCHKKMRMIYCPHGNSDKGYSLKDFPRKDMILVYGNHMLDLLKKTGALDRISSYVVTGNFRADFYLQNKSFYKTLTKRFVDFKNKKKTLLYAPTWSDGENTSSFFTRCEQIIGALKSHFNLIVKLHPFLEEQALAETHSVAEKYKGEEGVLFLSHFPAIYPLLDACDGYLGDFSSIGYDMLFFGKPMFFFASHTGPIYQCGQEVPLEADVLQFITKNWEQNKNHFAKSRKETYEYCFGSKKDRKEILIEIKRALTNDRALFERA